MSAHAVPLLTPAQYLEIERAAETKSEYYDGEMYAMSGGTIPHSVIGAGVIAALGLALRGRRCAVATSDLRVRISETGPFVYPDVTVYCGAPEVADDHDDVLLNPVAVFEVLSKSTEAHDRGRKFAHYRKIPSLKEYVLVSQTEPRIEVFSRRPEGWILTEFAGMNAICELPSLNCAIALADVYAGVALKADLNIG